MGLNKQKRVLVWCNDGKSIKVPEPSGFKWGIMCQEKPKLKRIRCPECNKLFTPRITTCGDEGCWHINGLPPHKKYIKVKNKYSGRINL